MAMETARGFKMAIFSGQAWIPDSESWKPFDLAKPPGFFWTGGGKDHVKELLNKEAIYPIDSATATRGFTSPLILVHKKGGENETLPRPQTGQFDNTFRTFQARKLDPLPTDAAEGGLHDFYR